MGKSMVNDYSQPLKLINTVITRFIDPVIYPTDLTIKTILKKITNSNTPCIYEIEALLHLLNLKEQSDRAKILTECKFLGRNY